jgi:hypothetical protein
MARVENRDPYTIGLRSATTLRHINQISVRAHPQAFSNWRSINNNKDKENQKLTERGNNSARLGAEHKETESMSKLQSNTSTLARLQMAKDGTAEADRQPLVRIQGERKSTNKEDINPLLRKTILPDPARERKKDDDAERAFGFA